MLHVLMLLLSSGVFTLRSYIREYHPIEQLMTWEEAKIFCRQEYSGLATIGNHEDRKRLIATANQPNTEFWVGLHKTDAASWMWSVGETETSEGSAEYTNWVISPASYRKCGGMLSSGKWVGRVCEDRLPFVCQEGKDSRISFVAQSKSWREAQDYCRQNFLDLASARNHTENQALYQLVQASGSFPLWIGLFRDTWKWSDGSQSSFRFWRYDQPNENERCVLYNSWRKELLDRSCLFKTKTICYKKVLLSTHKKVQRYVVRMDLESNSLSDFTDPDVSDAILKMIQNKTGLVNLQWRVQPDGKVFHKRKIKEEADEETEDIDCDIDIKP